MLLGVEGGHLDTGSSQRDAVHVTTQLTNAYLDLGELAAAKALMPKVTALRADLWDAATARALDQAIREQRALLAIREQRGAEAREALRISGMPATKLADCYLSLGLTAQARRVLEEANGPSPDVAKTTRLILLPAPAGEDARRKLFESLRTQAAGGDLSLPLLQQLAPLAKSFGFPEDWRNNIPGRAADHDDHGIGPERWRPPAATDFTLLRSNSKKHRLSDHQGQPVVVIFYLGFGCLHCVEQLRDFHPHVDAYRDAGLEILAIGTDSVQNMQEARAELPYAEKFAYTMLSDAKEKVFRQWRAFDFFAAEIMHGTFLVDPGGRMVFQDISHEPFNHPAWFLEECQRLLGRVK